MTVSTFVPLNYLLNRDYCVSLYLLVLASLSVSFSGLLTVDETVLTSLCLVLGSVFFFKLFFDCLWVFYGT
jgi:hypothetical protein